jgi:hypothetical protein
VKTWISRFMGDRVDRLCLVEIHVVRGWLGMKIKGLQCIEEREVGNLQCDGGYRDWSARRMNFRLRIVRGEAQAFHRTV